MNRRCAVCANGAQDPYGVGYILTEAVSPQVRLARGDLVNAVAELERACELSKEVQEPFFGLQARQAQEPLFCPILWALEFSRISPPMPNSVGIGFSGISCPMRSS